MIFIWHGVLKHEWRVGKRSFKEIVKKLLCVPFEFRVILRKEEGILLILISCNLCLYRLIECLNAWK
jgi:hypothetical protein